MKFFVPLFFNPSYAIHLVRVWEASGVVVDVQFFYQHVISGRKVAGPRLACDRVALNIAAVDYYLAFGESIVRVDRWLGEREKLLAIAMTTNAGQVIKAGKPVGVPTPETIPRRKIFCSLAKIKQRGNAVKSHLIASPSLRQLKSEYANLIRACNKSTLLDADAKKDFLAGFATEVHEVGLLARRGFVVAPPLIAVLLIRLKQARRQFEPRLRQGLFGLGLTEEERTAELQRILDDLSPLRERVGDFQTTEMGILTKESDSIEAFLKQDVLATNFERFLDLHAAYPAKLAVSGVFDRLMRFFARTGDVDSIRKVAEDHAHAHNITIPVAMAACANRVALVRIAVAAGQHLVLVWLITEAELDPIDPPRLAIGCDSPTTPVRELAQGVQDEEARELVLTVLDCVASSRIFPTRVTQGSAVTVAQLDDLVQHITSVADLRIFVDCTRHLAFRQQQRLVKEAVEHTLEERRGLLLGVDAAAYFKIVLEMVEKRELINAFEAETLLVRRTRANTASANCILQLKESQAVQKREMKNIRTAVRSIIDQLAQLRHHEYTRMRREQRARLVSALSTLLFGFGGQAFRVLGNLVDLSEPVDLFTTLVQIDPATLGRMLADNTAEFVYKHGVEDALRSMGAEPRAFVQLVRDIAELDHRERVTETGAGHGSSLEDAVMLSVRHQRRLHARLLAARCRLRDRAQQHHWTRSQLMVLVASVVVVVMVLVFLWMLMDDFIDAELATTALLQHMQ